MWPTRHRGGVEGVKESLSTKKKEGVIYISESGNTMEKGLRSESRNRGTQGGWRRKEFGGGRGVNRKENQRQRRKRSENKKRTSHSIYDHVEKGLRCEEGLAKKGRKSKKLQRKLKKGESEDPTSLRQ